MTADWVLPAPVCLCVWQDSASGLREVHEPSELWREFLPTGSFAVSKEEPQVGPHTLPSVLSIYG